MASTNSTTNLQLSQFSPDDTPKWLQDYNGDMRKLISSQRKQKRLLIIYTIRTCWITGTL